jgi:hypothetical protein
MRSGLEERRERGCFGSSRAVGRLDNHKWPYRQNSKSLLVESNSSKRGLIIRGMFSSSDRMRE